MSRYARGDRALGICERCSKKTLLHNLIYDGQYPDLLVCTGCYDPKHPQEYLPAVTDPVTLYDPTGDPDSAVANRATVNVPAILGLRRTLYARMALAVRWTLNRQIAVSSSGSTAQSTTIYWWARLVRR